jgi:hypothetical protein
MTRRTRAKPRLMRRKSPRRSSDAPVETPASLAFWVSIAAKKAAGTVRARTLLSVLALLAKIGQERRHGPDCEKSEV